MSDTGSKSNTTETDSPAKPTENIELGEQMVAQQEQYTFSNHLSNSSRDNETSKEVRPLVNQQKSLLSDDNIKKHDMEVDNNPTSSHIQAEKTIPSKAEATSNLHQDAIDPKDDEPHQLKTTLFTSTSSREVLPRNQAENTSVASESNETSSNQSPFGWSSTAPPLPPSERTQASLEAWRRLEQKLEKQLLLDEYQDDGTPQHAATDKLES